MSRTSGRITYANVTSTLALVVALGAGGAYAAGSVKSKDIVDGQVKAVDMHRNAVGSSTIKDRSVSAADLGAGSVSTTSVQDGAIKAENLGAGSVSTANVKDGSLQESDLATGSIGTFAIRDGGVVGADLGNNSVTTAKLQDGQVQTADLGNNVVTGVKVQDGTLTLADIIGGDTTLNVSATSLAANRCVQANANVQGAAAGQVAFVTSTSAVPVGWSVSVLKVNDGGVTVNLCNLSGAAATLTNLPVRVVTFG